MPWKETGQAIGKSKFYGNNTVFIRNSVKLTEAPPQCCNEAKLVKMKSTVHQAYEEND